MVTLSVEEAQQTLKSLAERALKGEPIFIRVGGSGQILSLQSVPTELPPNYLAQCYGPQEIAEEDYLANFAPKGTAT
jgi:hypothetical protein